MFSKKVGALASKKFAMRIQVSLKERGAEKFKGAGNVAKIRGIRVKDSIGG